MKTVIISTIAAAVLAAATASAQFSIDAINQAYTQNFAGFDGTEGSLPAGWSGQGGGTNIWRGAFNSSTAGAGDFTGVMAATNGTSPHSIVWRESTGGASLNNFRLYFAVTNNTGTPITSFNFSYTLETWVNGRRDNEMRFKYDTDIDGLFNTDILPRNSAFTRNPNHTPTSDAFVLDGSLEANRTLVTGTIDLTTYLIDESNPGLGVMGALGVGETAYFRWQISNNQLTDGNRSALGINNFEFTAVPEPSTYAALLGLLALGWVAIRRRVRA